MSDHSGKPQIQNHITGGSDDGFDRTRLLLDDAIRSQQAQLTLDLPGAPSRFFIPSVLAGAGLLFIMTVVWAQMSGFLDARSGKDSADVLAAGLVFLAAVLTQSVVTVSLLIGHYANQRQYRLATFEQLRLGLEASQTAARSLVEISRQATESELGSKHHEAEFLRLRHETAIKAIELLVSEAAFSQSGRRCVVVNTLIGLGVNDVATSLLLEAWSDPDQPIDSAAAAISTDHLLRSPELDPINRSDLIFMIWANRDKLFERTEGDTAYLIYWPNALISKWPDDLSKQDETHLIQSLWWVMWRIASSKTESEALDLMLLETVSNQAEHAWAGPARDLWLRLGSVLAQSSLISEQSSKDARRIFALDDAEITSDLVSITAMLEWFRDKTVHVEPNAPVLHTGIG